MKQGKYADSEREFALALKFNHEFSKAYAGLSLISAYKGDFDKAFDLIKNAKHYANASEEKVFVHICAMRIYAMEREKGSWLEKVKQQFDHAVELDRKSAAAYYFMGMAYKTELEFDKAGIIFAKVLDFNDEYVEEADREWRLLQKIKMVMPDTSVGKTIAIKESITRADAAALFISELGLHEIYERAGIKASRKTSMKKKDISDHLMRRYIWEIQYLGVQGLETYPDGSFHPDGLVSRSAYAEMIADVFIKATGKEGLSSKFKGSMTPFPDLNPDHPSFNAVMVVTTEGIMKARDITTSEFSPLGPLSGVDALMIIKNLKDKLMYY
jgi:tetratricopeptide (TPR) repeat protein